MKVTLICTNIEVKIVGIMYAHCTVYSVHMSRIYQELLFKEIPYINILGTCIRWKLRTRCAQMEQIRYIDKLKAFGYIKKVFKSVQRSLTLSILGFTSIIKVFKMSSFHNKECACPTLVSTSKTYSLGKTLHKL